MSNATAVSASASDQAKPVVRASANQAPLWVTLVPLLALFAAAVFLFWLSKGDMAGSFGYWELFIPVVAVVSLFSGWGQAYVNDTPRLIYVVKQLVHWGLLIGLVYVLNSQGVRGLMNDQQYTTVLLYLLGFTTLLAAVHVDIKLLFFGVFLVFCGYLIAVPVDNPTLVAIGNAFGIAEAQSNPLTVTMGVALVGFVATLFLVFMLRGAILSKRIADKRKVGV